MRPWETGDKWSAKIGEYLTKRATMVGGEALGQVETYGTLGTGYWLRSYMDENYPEYAEKFPLVGTNSLLRNFERVYDPQSENVVRLSDEDLEELDAQRIEDVNPAIAGFLGGLGLPIIFSWIVGGLFAAGVAFVIGKVALGLRSDYLAIVTLGISEIVVINPSKGYGAIISEP
mgnify:CR=1 FL=1